MYKKNNLPFPDTYFFGVVIFFSGFLKNPYGFLKLKSITILIVTEKLKK